MMAEWAEDLAEQVDQRWYMRSPNKMTVSYLENHDSMEQEVE